MSVFRKSELTRVLFTFCLLMTLIYYCLSAIGFFIVDTLSYGIFFGFLGIAYLVLGVDFGNQFRRNKPEVFK